VLVVPAAQRKRVPVHDSVHDLVRGPEVRPYQALAEKPSQESWPACAGAKRDQSNRAGGPQSVRLALLDARMSVEAISERHRPRAPRDSPDQQRVG
jgi:hypothetical protein